MFGRTIGIQLHARAQDGHGMLCPYNGKSRGEAGFGERDREATVGNVVGGLDGTLGGERNEAIDEALFGGEVHGGRLAGSDSSDRLRVFGGGEFASEFLRRGGAC